MLIQKSSAKTTQWTPPEFPIEEIVISQHAVEVFAPVLSNGETVGYVLIRQSTSKLYNRLKEFIKSSIIAKSIALTLALSIAYFLIKRIANPIEMLSKMAIQIGDRKDYSLRITESGNDEIGTLMRQFNHMLDKLEQQNREILLSHKTLEDRVETRTKELKEARDEAQRSNQAKSEFLSRMSHELRTPLNSIIGFSELLSMTDISKSHVSNVLRINKAGKHLLNLINEVLDVSRIDSGHINFSFESVNLTPLLQEVIDLLGPMAQEYKVDLEFNNQMAPGIAVRADKQRLRQVFLNLMSNAIKYNHENGNVRVRYEVTNDKSVRILFVNTGSGIPADKIDRLFNPFDRLDAERNNLNKEGTGLGLALSKKLVEAMKGSICASSSVGKFTEFCVELQIAPSVLTDDKDGNSRINPGIEFGDQTSQPPFTVLYVENNPDNFQYIEQILSDRPQVHLLTAIQGTQAFDLATRRIPDLIFLDVELPDIDWKDLLHRFHQNDSMKSIPTYLLSADMLMELDAEAKSLGASGCLLKPTDVETILNLVDTVSNSKRDHSTY